MATRQCTCQASEHNHTSIRSTNRGEWSESLDSIPPYWLGKKISNESLDDTYLSRLPDDLLSDLSEYLRVESIPRIRQIMEYLGPVYKFGCGPFDVTFIPVETLLTLILSISLYFILFT